MIRKELDEEWINNQKDVNIVLKIDYLNDLFDKTYDLRKSNLEWLNIILDIVNKRDYNYTIKYLSGIRNNIKWNVYVLVRDGIDIKNIAKDEVNGIIFMAPDLYSEYYVDNNFVVYDTFYGDNIDYLEKEVDIRKFLNRAKIRGLKDREIVMLEEMLFLEFKEEKKNERIRRI